MLQRISQWLSSLAVEKGAISSGQEELYSFAFSLLIMQVISWLSMMVLAVAFGVFWQALGYLMFFVPLRTYAGGRHASTPMRCYFVSMLMCVGVFSLCIAAVGYLQVWTIVLSAIAATTIISCLAPVADPNKPIPLTDVKLYRRKATAIAIAECVVICLLSIMPTFKSFSVFFVAAQVTAATLLMIPKHG